MSQEKRESQESKVTSTPQRVRTPCSSPSLSCISADTSTSNTYIGTSHVPLPIHSLVEQDDAFEAPTVGNIKKSGKFWQIFKPMSSGTLYELIFLNPSGSQDLVYELLSKYRASGKFVVMSILKLCVDVAGFQHFDIDEIYDYDNCDAKRTITFLNMQELDNKLLNSGQYLMQASQNQEMTVIRKSLYSFFQNLVVMAHQKEILYDDLFIVHLFEFIRCMSFSTLKPIRHAGILFSLKLMTTCSILYRNLCNEHIKVQKSLTNTEITEELKYKKRKMLKYIDFLYLIFRKNCLIPDKQSHHVRAECLKEMINWIDNIPDFILDETKCLDLLRKLSLDESYNVRLCALDTCEHLINLDLNPEELASKVFGLIETLGSRIYDINYAVAVRACEMFIVIMEKFPMLMEAERFKSILKLVYHEHYNLATTAAKFVNSYLRTICRDGRDVLLKLADISETFLFTDKTDILVESMLTCTPELLQCEIFLSLFDDENLMFRSKKSLLQMFWKSIEQSLSNVSPRNTETENNSSMSRDINKSMLMKFLPNVVTLLEIFNEDGECQILIFKIIRALDLTSAKSTVNVYCSEIISCIEKTIMHADSDNSDLVEQGIETFAYFSNNMPDFNRRASNIAKTIAKNLVDEFKEYVEKDNLASSPEYVRHLYNVTLKLSKYSASFDLTELIHWSEFFDYVDFEISETAENCIVCAKHHLIWSMKNIINMADNKTIHNFEPQIRQIAEHCKNFLKSCFQILNRNKGSSLELVAFASICDLAFTYNTDLEGPIKFNSGLIILQIKLDNEEQDSKQLFRYFESHVVQNKNLTPSERKTYLLKIIELLYSEILPAKYFSNLLQLYCRENAEYQEIFGCLFKHLQEVEAFEVAIVHTLINKYTELISKYEALNINGDEFLNLKIVAKKLSTVKTKDTNKIVSLGMNYALRNKTNYDFLYLLKYFAVHLRFADKQSLLEKLQHRVPTEDIGKNVMLYFSTVLKSHGALQKSFIKKPKVTEKKGQQHLKVQRKPSDSSHSRSEYSVHDSSSDEINISDAE